MTAVSREPSAVSQNDGAEVRLFQAVPIEAPRRVVLCPAGLVQRNDGGEFLMDSAAAEVVMAAFKRIGRDSVIDYEHQTEGGKFSSPDGRAPAAGWIKALEFNSSQGLIGTVDWTSPASKHIEQKEYRYLSPVLLVRKSDNRVVALLRAGLTNDPAIRAFPALVNRDGPEGQETKGLDMSAIASALGLSTDAGTDAVITAINKLKEEVAEHKAKGKGSGDSGGGGRSGRGQDGTGSISPNKISPIVCKALGLAEDADEAAVVAAINSTKGGGDAGQVQLLTSKLAETTASLAKLQEEIVGDQVQVRINKAISEGRITKADLDHAEKGAYLKATARDAKAWDAFASILPQKAPASGTLVNSAGATGSFAGGDAGGTDRVSIINSAKREWEAEKGLQATTTRSALASLALRDKGLDPKLSAEELKLVA